MHDPEQTSVARRYSDLISSTSSNSVISKKDRDCLTAETSLLSITSCTYTLEYFILGMHVDKTLGRSQPVKSSVMFKTSVSKIGWVGLGTF